MRIIIGVLVAGAGMAHFTNANFFTRLVPDSLQAHAGTFNALTGAVQTAMGLCFLVWRLRAFARWSTMALLVLTLPAAIGPVVHPDAIEKLGLSPALAAIRVLAQLFMIALGWRVTKREHDGRHAGRSGSI